jgi:sugar lactone lactonase YvrE
MLRRTLIILAMAGCAADDVAPDPADTAEDSAAVISSLRHGVQFSTFAEVTDDGQFPESLLVDGDTLLVGTTQFPNDLFDPTKPSDGLPSLVIAFDHRTGRRTGQRALSGELATRFRGVAGLARDARGRIYAADAHGRIVRFTGATQTVYATLPDLTDDVFARPPLADGPTFDEDGFLYVADPLQGALFRVPPGGGTAELWFRAPALDSALAGPNTIRISPDGRWLYFTVTFIPDPTFTSVRTELFRLPLRARPRQDELHLVAEWSSPLDFSIPSYVCSEGFQLDVLGNLYVVANVGGPDFVRVLRPNGTELGRIESPLFADPSDLAFDNRRRAMFVVNHLADPSLRQILVAPWPIPGAEQPTPFVP